MTHRASEESDQNKPENNDRPLRADAKRNTDALIKAAAAVFATSGVDAPVREIAAKAGVGVGTLYRNFPQRADLLVAVFRREIDACADAAPILATQHEPAEALAQWMQYFVDFLATKRGLAATLHSGDPAFEVLPAYFKQRVVPALQGLLDAAAAAKKIRGDITAWELLGAASSLGMHGYDQGPEQARRMVALLVDGLRYSAGDDASGGS
ncbi:MAG: TetR/AcrR family transcriptional regulator [Hyphomicrobiales bacterium]|nr:MAG: TetR/AcrR family transcriptional regulator [Hyphomicrobiales bacterium]